MPFSISCKSIPLLLFIVQTCANELNVLELGTQVDSILSQDINLPTFDGSTATFEDIADGALQQHDQHPSNLNPLLDCAASSSNIIQSPTGRKMRRMRYKRGGGGDGGAVCQWQEFREDGPETTTIPEDERLRGKRRRPKPSPGRDPGPIGPINNPEQPNNLEPAPYKLDRKADPQKCPFGQQNIPVCYPKVAIPQNNPALMLSPCRTGTFDIYKNPFWTSVRICHSHL